MMADPADAYLRSIIELFGHEWWRRQQDRAIAAWYERACAHLGLTPPENDAQLDSEASIMRAAAAWRRNDRRRPA
jgi:hypothetical protein